MDGDISEITGGLTLDEKLRLVHGAVDPDGKATGYLPGVDRVGVPPLSLVDGPLGVRASGERATAFPASVALAASWRPSLARRFGRALAGEAAAHGQDIVLAPGVNIARVPHGGRNFEYYGEDPYLTARTGVAVIDGLESEGVAATVKHFVANNQETNRYDVSAAVSERALREIYLPAFRAAVEEADVTSVMTAYNRVNGTHMSDHGYLLSDVLKGEWGFDGFVVSDWWGTRSTVAAARAGLDVEMPGIDPEEFVPTDIDVDDVPEAMPPVPDVPALFGDPLREAVESGELDEAVVDEKVARVLRGTASIGRFDEEPAGELDAAAHRELAREIATEGAVLLRNDGTLPLGDVGSLAVIGPNADRAKLGGGGSSEVSPFTRTSPVEGLEAREVSVTVERGVPPVSESRMFGAESDEEGPDPSIDDAVDAAAAADCAVVVVQDDATEFRDRPDLGLPGRQDDLVEAVAGVADRTVVVLRTSGPVEMPWLDAVDAVLETWYPGQADGDALADLLFGDAEPGGRLPTTFGRSAADYPASDETAFPGVNDVARYDEGVFVGYRYFDERDVRPAFPFGHGLSYTSFAYGQPSVTEDGDGFAVAVPVENTGDRRGKTVVQVYAQKAAAPVPTPERELVGFEATTLEAGERRTPEVSVARSEFEYYDEQTGWTLASGENALFVGRSARDIVAEIGVSVR
ncbi:MULTISPECIES: beta-glucosidase [Halorubrum]|uniref:Beta-glucosidase n=2 Tax=Halorubrum TaxID=56688 RepID=A0A1I6HAA7_HALSD|nr:MULTISPECIES: glycoside hydrolase family 3 C-terminal domain-containing protein [Halorubrum]TKX71387.1 glycosyl hydrolase [Halorubrum sp. SP9]SFR51308.1 beta-glucosidase [Halorubrum sodomense]